MKSPGKLAHSPELDGIRAIAVVAVILYHFGISTSSVAFDGKAGVTVFFALSGYLITRLLIEEAESNGSISIKDFYRRRFRRILPVSTIGVAAAIAVTLWRGFPSIKGQAIASLGWSANWERYSSSVAYGESTYAPLTHFWSLAVEEQFYVVLPAMVILAYRFSRSKSILAVVFGVGAVASAVVAVVTSDNAQSYYRTDARVVELLVGSLLAIACVRFNVDAWNRGRQVVGHIALAALIVTLSIGSLHVPQHLRLLTSALTIIVIIARPRLLGFKPFPQVGLISFALYVFHPIALVAASGSVTAALIITAGVSIMSYHAIEKPIRRKLSWKAARNVIAVSFAATLAAACAPQYGHNVPPVLQPVAPVVTTPRTTDPAAPTTTAPASKIRVTVVGDSSMRLNFAQAIQARANADDAYEFVDSPSPETDEHGIVLGLPKSGCPLLVGYTVRYFDGSSRAPEERCDWRDWVPQSLDVMDVDIVIASFGGPTAMWEYEIIPGVWVAAGDPEFNMVYQMQVLTFEQMAAERGAKVVWVAYPDVSLGIAGTGKPVGAYSSWEDPAVVDALASMLGSRECSADIRWMTRDADLTPIYMDTTHLTAEAAAIAANAVMTSPCVVGAG